MSQHRSAQSLELEIQALLKYHGTADLAADALLKKYGNEKLSKEEFETLAIFLLHAGFCATLADLIVRKLKDHSQIPWGHFVEGLFMASAFIDPEIKQALIEGAKAQDGLSDLARNQNLDYFEEQLPILRKERWEKAAQEKARAKDEIVANVKFMKNQGLKDQEEKAIEQLAAISPSSETVQVMRSDLQQRQAQEMIEKKTTKKARKSYLPLREQKDPETQNLLNHIEFSMQEQAAKNPELVSDFALAHFHWNNEEATLRLLTLGPLTATNNWLRAEALLKARRFIELLDFLNFLEQTEADPEIVFSTNYLRAQAMWGLNERESALELMQKIVDTRPNYRVAHALLQEWIEVDE